MCGIAGMFCFAGSSKTVDEGVLRRMGEALSHRGPDDQGSYIDPDRRVGLVHRRLSILDTSANGHQPMANEDGSLWITYNGEVYNSPDLRPQLCARGHVFRSRTDTEVIVHAFEEEGLGCVRHLDGMFAFGLYSRRERRLYLVRDRLGIKPLYYYQGDGFLLFASEIKALFAHPEVRRELCPEALGQYLSFRTTMPPLTLFAGIRKLPAGSSLICDDDGSVSVSEYWDPYAAEIEIGDAPQNARRLRALLRESVGQLLLSDVPLGAFLSGGLDSSAIVGLMAEQVSSPVETLTVVWDGHPEFNEGGFPELVSRRFRTRSHEVRLDHHALLGYLQELVHAQDEPLADVVSLPLHYLSEATRRQGLKVVLVGEGSDEIFLGYESRLEAIAAYERRWRPLLALPRPLRRGLFAGAELWSQLSQGSRLAADVHDKLGRLSRDDEIFYGSVAFSDRRKDRLLSGYGRQEDRGAQAVLRAQAAWLLDRKPGAGFVDKVMNLDLRLRLAELLLPRVDRMTMASGLEARVPFLQHRLVEFALRVPPEQKIDQGQGKKILKDAVCDLLPAEVVDRPKQPFGVPLAPWLRGELADFAERTILGSRLRERGLFDYDFVAGLLGAHRAGTEDREVEIWTLLCLSAWHDKWL